MTMDNTIACQDQYEFMANLPDKCIDLIVADPDYGLGKISKTWGKVDPVKLFEDYNRVIKDTGVIATFGTGIFTVDMISANRKNYKYTLIWEKDRTTGFLNAKKMPLRSHEDIAIFYKKQPTYNPQKWKGMKAHSVGKALGNVMNDNNLYGNYKRTHNDTDMKFPRSVLNFKAVTNSKTIYPTQKPVELIEYLIKTFTNEGDVVLDTCVGSGTTAEAAIKQKRIILACDNSQKAYDITVARIAPLIVKATTVNE